MVCAKFAHTTFDSNSLYLEQLPRQFELFLRREFRVVLLERLGVAHGDKVRFGVVGVADSPGARDHEAALAVERDVPFDFKLQKFAEFRQLL